MLTHRFDEALIFAARAHRDQRRKGSNAPYISHLMGVAALVLEYGGDEAQAIGALLHDAVEDQGGMEMAQRIAQAFGPRVRDIVLACSDSDGDQKAPWDRRKQDYLAGIPEKSDDAILVTACDKLHNASAILWDLEIHGDAVFDRFTARKEGTLWYYAALAEALGTRLPGPLTGRLTATVAAIHAKAGITA